MNNELQQRLIAALERPHRLGMIGGELEEQLAHCASFSRVLGEVATHEQGKAFDLGTGGGLPGVALAQAHPDFEWILVEIRTSRATEVERALMRLGDRSTSVVTRPAQELGQDPQHRQTASVVVARSFGPPAMVAECAAALLAIGGILVVSEPPEHDRSDDRWPADSLDGLGFGRREEITDGGYSFVALVKTGETPEVFPRLPPRNDRDWPRFT